MNSKRIDSHLITIFFICLMLIVKESSSSCPIWTHSTSIPQSEQKSSDRECDRSE